MTPLAREFSLALVLVLPSAALAQTATPIITPQPGGGYVIQQPGRSPVYVNPLPGRGNYWINDMNIGPLPPVPPQPAPSVDSDTPDD